jgi:uncharacterized protein YfaQ (DUF2300 family)
MIHLISSNEIAFLGCAAAMGLSIRAYAAQRGVSHTAVRKAVSSGRLTLEPDGSIDAAKADRNWVQNADPSKVRDAPKLKPVPTAAVGAVRDTLSEAGAPVVGGMSYLHARTAEKVLTVQLLREKLRREKGEVVERDYAIEQGFAFARRLRDAWVNWPARVAALMAADLGVEVHKLEGLLTHHVREQLKASAGDELNLLGP